MLKNNYFILMIFLLSHCSIDTKSGLWENRNFIDDKKKIMSKISFDTDLSFEDFKKNVVLYGKKSNYPNLMEK
tara:strand:- start:435 stop:653 length:219 start_codon:yes stop_codon:yes gene_type:complete